MKKRICMFAALMLALSLVVCGCDGFSDVGDGTTATGEAPTTRSEESSGTAAPDTGGHLRGGGYNSRDTTRDDRGMGV